MLPRQAISACRNDPPLLERFDHQLHGVGQILLAGVDVQFECLQRFVDIVNLGEFLEFSLMFWLGGL